MSKRYKQHRRMRRRATHGLGLRFSNWLRFNCVQEWTDSDMSLYIEYIGKDRWYIPVKLLVRS
jgi:3'-phosphoadenosine 5'-phosphosulfate sulfotransferase (PAPS reductase)/FAD synthetase